MVPDTETNNYDIKKSNMGVRKLQISIISSCKRNNHGNHPFIIQH